MSITNGKSRAITRVRGQPDNKWAWYELCKAYCVGSVDELITLAGSVVADNSSVHQGFEEWLQRAGNETRMDRYSGRRRKESVRHALRNSQEATWAEDIRR